MTLFRTISTCVWIILAISTGCSSFSRMMERSGTEFIVQIDTDDADKGSIVERAIKTTESKLNQSRIEGEVKRDPGDPNRMIVRVFGVKDLERTKKFLFSTYQLELRKAVSPPAPAPLQMFPSMENARKVAKDDQEVLPFLERVGLEEQFVILEKNSIVNGDDITDARPVLRSGTANTYTIAFSLRASGAMKFGEWTGNNIGNYLAIVIDKKIQSIAFIKTKIYDSGEINGRFGKEQAEDIAMGLKSGYLPATMKVVDERQVGN